MAKRTLKDIKKAIPNIKSEKVEVLADELDKVLAIKSLWQSDGGKQLVTVLRNNCANTLRKLIETSKDKPELSTLLGLIAMYSANIDLLSTVQDISMEQELREQLDEAVKEAME